MSEKRRDNRNRILREGEYQRADGRYRFRYIDEDGKEKNVYSWRLDKNDPMPKGKKREPSLRGMICLRLPFTGRNISLKSTISFKSPEKSSI